MSVKNVGHNLWDIDVAIKVNGKQLRRLRRSWKGSERAALKLQHEFLKEVQRIADLETSKNEIIEDQYPTFNKVIEDYVKIRKPSDFTSYNRIINDMSAVLTDPKSIKTFVFGGINEKGEQIEAYIKKLEKMKACRFNGYGMSGSIVETNRLLSQNTKNKIYRAIKAVCIWAHEQGIINSNPITQKVKWKEVPRNRTLSDDELDKLYKVIEKEYPHYLPIYLHSIRNPSRISDLRRLTKTNLNMHNKTIQFITNKKKIPVTQFIYPELEDHFSNIPEQCPYLFYRPVETENGKIFEPIGNFKKAWSRAKQLAGIKNLRWHDLRHHALTWLLTKMNLRTHHVMNIGGWSSRQIIEVYHNADHEASIAEAQQFLNLAKKPKRRKRKS